LSDVVEVRTREELDNLLSTNERVVTDFAAPAWCGPCIRFAPHFEAAAGRSDATFVHIDVDKADADLVSEYNIQSVPTVLGFKDGALTATIQSRTVVPLLREVESL
jgi:thiol-disulfide isomerase/thioredoxin